MTREWSHSGKARRRLSAASARCRRARPAHPRPRTPAPPPPPPGPRRRPTAPTTPGRAFASMTGSSPASSTSARTLPPSLTTRASPRKRARAPRPRPAPPPPLDEGLLGAEELPDLVEVLHVRADDDGPAREGRLEDVVPARRDEAPPHE